MPTAQNEPKIQGCEKICCQFQSNSDDSDSDSDSKKIILLSAIFSDHILSYI